MNNDLKSREKELEQWLDSNVGAKVQTACRDDYRMLPGEEAINDKVISRVWLSPDSSLRIKLLETGLRRWRWAAVVSSAVAVVFAVAMISIRDNASPSDVVSNRFVPAVLERERKSRVIGGQDISVSRVSVKLGETRKKLTALSSRPRFKLLRKKKT